QGLQAGVEYLLRVKDDVRTTRYELAIRPLAGQADMIRSLSPAPGKAPADVIIGGLGNDVLMGGRGEDWIFGGAGNDVLTGGLDRQAPDLLVGGPTTLPAGQTDDDTFQLLTDALFDPDDNGISNGPAPQVASPQADFVDRMSGGVGNDRVLFLGGDLDAQRRP